MHGIDEFFERLSWYSPAEVQRAAIEEARAVRNLKRKSDRRSKASETLNFQQQRLSFFHGNIDKGFVAGQNFSCERVGEPRLAGN